jgi:hypothetical protein
MCTPRFRLALLFILAGSIASPAVAVNLVVNPSFAGDTTGWELGRAVAFAPVDATGVAGSGSAVSSLFNFDILPTTELAISQCITTGPGNYTFGGKVLLPLDSPVFQLAGVFGIIHASYFSGADCSTGFLGGASVGTGVRGSFQTLSAPITAPAGTTHIQITGINSVNRPGRHYVIFDDLVLDKGEPDIPALGPSDIPALGPFGYLALIVALAAMGIFVLRR